MGCIEWEGATTPRGYGKFTRKVGHRKYKTIAAHRDVYEKNVGPIPEGMVIRHSCDNPRCINIDHLLIGTQKENVKDREDRKRGNPPTGTRNTNAKLDDDKVRAIRLRSDESVSKLAKEFGVTRRVIYLVIKRDAWSHVD